jgi:two-component sensor histidine kinase
MGGAPVTLADITITSRFWSRPSRGLDVQTFASLMQNLADGVARDPTAIFEECAEIAMAMCRAHSAGITIVERTLSGDDVLHWIVLIGRLKDLLPRTMSRYRSVAGACIDSGAPLVVQRPERLNPILDVGVLMHEALHVPLGKDGDALRGTICVLSHSVDREFEPEDARILQHLAVFVTTAVKMTAKLEVAKHDAEIHAVAFRELNHRIKNTLQLTADILRLQMNEIGDESARSAIESARDRLMAMGHVHSIQSGVEECELGEVLDAVCGTLGGAHLSFQVKLELADKIVLPANRAAIVALIANELVTNAFKHAFKHGAAGIITVGVVRSGANEAQLCVSDNAAAANDVPLIEGTGLRLIRLLSSQIGGSFGIEGKGKRFTVVFPLSEPRH